MDMANLPKDTVEGPLINQRALPVSSHLPRQEDMFHLQVVQLTCLLLVNPKTPLNNNKKKKAANRESRQVLSLGVFAITRE